MEQVGATLTDLGVHVTLYGTGDSATRTELCSVVAHGYEEDDSDGALARTLHGRPGRTRGPGGTALWLSGAW